MYAHELARQLLKGPDFPVAILIDDGKFNAEEKVYFSAPVDIGIARTQPGYSHAYEPDPKGTKRVIIVPSFYEAPDSVRFPPVVLGRVTR